MLRPNLAKVVLTKSGQTTRTYDISSTANRIIRLNHTEQEWSQLAPIAVESDSTLAALNLHGYQGVISYGYNDATNGDEFSAAAPLEVISQKTDTLMTGKYGQLVTGFTLAGVFDMMNFDHASVAFTPEDTNRDTVKTILTAIAAATMPCFSHTKAYTITFDATEETLLDSFIPADFFSVGFNESRLSAFKKALRWVKSKARIEDDGEIHVFNPTVSGTSYDYEYNDAVSNHNFFVKSVRERLVLPSQVTVQSHPSHIPGFTGTANDTATNAALGRYHTEYHYAKLTSDSEAGDIATAILQGYQVGAERGRGNAPMNCGQEVMDWIKMTDSVASDTRTGNMGFLIREYSPGTRFQMRFGFGKLAQGVPFRGLGEAEPFATWEALQALQDYIDAKDDAIVKWVIGGDEATFKKLTVTDELLIPHEA